MTGFRVFNIGKQQLCIGLYKIMEMILKLIIIMIQAQNWKFSTYWQNIFSKRLRWPNALKWIWLERFQQKKSCKLLKSATQSCATKIDIAVIYDDYVSPKFQFYAKHILLQQLQCFQVKKSNLENWVIMGAILKRYN